MNPALQKIISVHEGLVERERNGQIPFLYLAVTTLGVLAAGWGLGVLTTIRTIEKNPTVIEQWQGFDNVDVVVKN